MKAFRERHRFLSAELAQRYARAYGTRADAMLDGIETMSAMGTMLAPGLYEAEAAYLVAHEWAQTADDILWRRTKLGMRASPADVERLNAWLAARDRAQRDARRNSPASAKPAPSAT